jgi:sulfate permease, SulP family
VTRNFWKWLPAASWLPELRNPAVLRTETLAGIYVAMVLIPTSVAYAQLAGLPPQVGLYAAFLPVAIGALFGVSRPLQPGPTALITLMTAAALGPLALMGSNVWIAYALTLALLVGLFQLGFGLLRLGKLVNFLANPVVAPSPYFGSEQVWDSQVNAHNPMMDQEGRVYFTAQIRSPKDPPPYCAAVSGHPSLSGLDTCRRTG